MRWPRQMPGGPREEPFPAMSRVRLRSLQAVANPVLNRRSGRVSPSARCSACCRRGGYVAPEGGGSGRSGVISKPPARRPRLTRPGYRDRAGTTDPTNQLLWLVTLCIRAGDAAASRENEQRETVRDGGRSPGRDGTAGGRVRLRPEERPGGGLLPAGGRAVHRDGRGRGIARPVAAPGAGHLVTRAVRAAGRAAGPDGGTDRPDAEAVARAAPEVGRRRMEHPDLGQCRARVRHQTGIPGPYRRAPPGRAGVRPHAHPGGERADRYRRGERAVFRPARRVRRAHRP